MALPSLKALVPIQIERKNQGINENNFSSHNKFSQNESQLGKEGRERDEVHGKCGKKNEPMPLKIYIFLKT